MDADVQSKILFFFEQFWSFLAVSIGVAMGGVAAKRIVAVLVPAERQIATAEGNGGPYRSSAAEIAIDSKLPLWYRLWRATISMHPVLVGGLVGLAPLPAATWVPDSTAAHVLWFGLAGALSGQIYEIGKRLAEIIPVLIKQKLGVRPSSRPPPPPAVVAEPVPTLADTLEPDEKRP
jgi:hypothetical protein